MLYADLVEYPTMPTSCLLQSIDLSTGEQIDKYIQADEFNKGSSVLSTSPDAPYFLSTMSFPFLFRHAFMETFIALTPDGVQPFLTVKSKNFVSKSDLEDVNAREGMMALRKTNKIFTLKNYFSNNDMIHFLNEGIINEAIKDQLTGIDEDSNPVIFYYEFK